MPKPIRKKATIDEVAELAGVSIATVSRYINKNSFVSDSAASRVQQAIEELNYRPVVAAQNLASRKTKTLGLVLPQISGVFFPSLLRGIEAGVQETNYHLLVYSTQTTAKSEVDRSFPLGDHNTDGLIVFANAIAENALKRFNNIDFPVLLLFQSSPSNLNIPSVGIENKAGAKRVVAHLIEIHNRKRIVFIKGPAGNEDSYWREQGYIRALTEYGLPYESSLIIEGGYNSELAQAQVEQLIGRSIKFDAIFAADDESAFGAMAALRAAIINIPHDVSLVGFDDIPLSSYLNPPLTTVSVPLEEIGIGAAKNLIQLIQTGQTEDLVLFPTKLIVRQSCGCE